MFDVPILDVASSSAPVVYGVNQVSEGTGFSKLPMVSALSSETVSPKISGVVDAPQVLIMGILQASASRNKALPTREPLQLVEPLDLASVVASMEEMLVLNEVGSVEGAFQTSTPSMQWFPKDKDNFVTTIGAGMTTTHVLKSETIPEALSLPLNQCVDSDYPQQAVFTTTFQVLHQGIFVGKVSGAMGSDSMVSSLQLMLKRDQLNSDDIAPMLEDDQPSIRLGDDVVMQVVETDNLDEPDLSNEWSVITWSDRLRQKMGASPLDAGDVQRMLNGLQSTGQQLDGTASWYGPYFHGRLTANGEIFDQNTLTAAHKSLPFDTVLQVRNLKNDRTVVVRINDRGPYLGQRSLDLSKAAAQCLGSEKAGVIPYEAVILKTSPNVPTVQSLVDGSLPSDAVALSNSAQPAVVEPTGLTTSIGPVTEVAAVELVE